MRKEIALVNCEPKIINTAYMQISKYHKEKGDKVEWFNEIKDYIKPYDHIYFSSIFTFTPKPKWIFKDKRVRYGGTGFDPYNKLPEEIEECNYDYSIYPNCEFSIIWFSRGCIRNCSFCIVRKKEGYIHSVEPKNLNPKGKWIRVMDNNFFANPIWREAIEKIKEWNQHVIFDGIDVRLLDEEQLKALTEVKIKGQIHIAWDNPKEKINKHIERIINLNIIKPYRFMCYVLVGYNSTIKEDLYRIEEIN